MTNKKFFNNRIIFIVNFGSYYYHDSKFNCV